MPPGPRVGIPGETRRYPGNDLITALQLMFSQRRNNKASLDSLCLAGKLNKRQKNIGNQGGGGGSFPGCQERDPGRSESRHGDKSKVIRALITDRK